MSVRTNSVVALLAVLLSTPAIAQSGGGAAGGGSGGSAGGAPSSTSSGTAGVSSSTSNPGVGTPGTPGPSTGVGLPGGTGPGNVTIAPNQPSPPASNQSVDSGGSGGSSPSIAAAGSRSTSGAQSRIPATENTQAANFHPEAVTEDALDAAAKDIAAMAINELRSLTQVFKTCTASEHPLDRIGRCGAVNRAHQSKFAKARQIDRTLVELERVVRFQSMFRTSVPTTEYEDRINNRLRTSTRLALTDSDLRERQLRESSAQPDLTRDVKMAR